LLHLVEQPTGGATGKAFLAAGGPDYRE